MILLLLLLPTLGLSSLLDWTECAKKTKCFCKQDANPQKLMKLAQPYVATEWPGCTQFGFQNKFFTQDSGLFQIEINGPEAALELKAEPRLKILEDATKESFGCKYNAKTEKVELDASPETEKKYKLKLFEQRSIFENEHVLCAIYMELAYLYAKDVTSNNWQPHVKLFNSKQNADTYQLGFDSAHWDEPYTSHSTSAIDCDPFTIKDLSYSPTYHVRPIMERDKDVLDCSSHTEPNKRTFKMMYDRKNKKEVIITNMKCGDGQMYSIDTGEPVMESGVPKIVNGLPVTEIETVPSPESYDFYCAIPFDEVCEEPKCVPEGSKECPKYEKGPPGTAATYKCKANKWIINNQYHVLADDPKCMREKYGNENAAAFYAKLPNSEEMITADARCFVDYDCKIKSSLNLPDESEDKLGRGLDQADPAVLRCADASTILVVTDAKTGVMWNETVSYVCDKATGSYYNDTDVVALGSTVRCIPRKEEDEVEGDLSFSEAEMYKMIGGTAGGIIIFIIIGSVIFCVVSNRKHKVKQMQKAEWVKLKKPARIKKCIEDWPLAIAATAETWEQLFVGLNDIEMLLETGTEDLKAWDGAYTFLLRLTCFLPKLDDQIYHLMNRYLVIQAKKIIDRLGWLAEEPITNSNRAGLMRTVAIRLLGLAMPDPKNFEAKEMLWRAWRRLGFNGAMQYPHAGTLWNVMLHTRPLPQMQKGHPQRRCLSFDHGQFMDFLREIATQKLVEMPAEDVIPEFGNVQYQAAYGLGGTPHYRIHNSEPENKDSPDPRFKTLISLTAADPTRDRDVPLAYWAGICDSLTHNPLVSLLEATVSAAGANTDLLNEMYKIKPEAEWTAHVQRAQRFVHYYGASNDAQRFYDRFMKKSPAFATELLEMQKEQQNFEEAVVRAKEQLREWLCERTDRDEFKKKEVYLRNTDEVKLDDKIGDYVEPPQGCTDPNTIGKTPATASNSSKGSSSNSAAPRSSGSKSSENDPRAAAAATPASPAVTTPSSSDAAAPAAAAAPAKP